MGAVEFNKVTRGYAVTLAPAGRFPIVGDRIFKTLADAQEFVDNYIYNTNNSPAPYRSEANAEVLKSDGNLNILR
jgi:hypothetical protein